MNFPQPGHEFVNLDKPIQSFDQQAIHVILTNPTFGGNHVEVKSGVDLLETEQNVTCKSAHKYLLFHNAC